MLAAAPTHRSTALPRRTNWAIAMCFWLLIALTYAMYTPGLAGGFLFDDFINLNALGAQGGVRDWNSFLLYLTSGIADPTGRPLSVLSFLIDGNDWPAHPHGFKRTNLGIHLLNASLLGWALLRLGARAGLTAAHAARAAVLGAALWALHPLWVSTTLYVVQRHAMLPVSFLLIAVLAWEAGWRQLEQGRARRAWLYGFFGVGVAAACAALSKANGALTPALLALIWWFLYRPQAPGLPVTLQAPARWLARAALLVPAGLVLAALVAQIPSAIDTANSLRPWTVGERLLSQPRALFDYLSLLWLPREGTAGIFADNFAISRGLFSPWTTLPALLGVVGLIGGALALRRRHPVAALALLFFFLGHIVESGWLPLEPYFEHRSYQPALLMFWPLAIWLTKAGHDKLRVLRLLLVWLLPLLLAGLTFVRATVWSDDIRLYTLFAERNPRSERAQLMWSTLLFKAGHVDLARQRLMTVLDGKPSSVNAANILITVECANDAVRPETIAAARTAYRTSPNWHSNSFRWFVDRIERLAQNGCLSIGPAALHSLLDAAEQNPRVADNDSWMQDILSLRAMLAFVVRDGDGALALFKQALDTLPTPDIGLWHAAQLGRFDYPQLALDYLDYYHQCCAEPKIRGRGMARIQALLKMRSGYYEKEFAHLRARLEQHALEQQALEQRALEQQALEQSPPGEKPGAPSDQPADDGERQVGQKAD